MSERIKFSPKDRFRVARTEDSLADYRELMASKTIQDSSQTVLAEMAWRCYPQEQIRGATSFLDMLLNLSEPESEPTQLPMRTLKAP